MNSAVAIIPTRHAPGRSPAQVLAAVGVEPRIVHALRSARQARTVSHVIVVTDSTEVARLVARDGGDCVMTPPAVASGLDRVAIVAQSLQCEIVVALQGEELLVDGEHIDRLVDALRRDADADIATMATTLENQSDIEDPNQVKVVVDDAGRALYFSRSPIPYRRQPTKLPVRKHIAVYAYRREALLRLASWPPHPLEAAEGLEQLRALAHGMRVHVVTSDREPTSARDADTMLRGRERLSLLK
jgi:3-deoxy-manno-octulosonate cytidylyltransferase (CMP-KDO synthetase)